MLLCLPIVPCWISKLTELGKAKVTITLLKSLRNWVFINLVLKKMETKTTETQLCLTLLNQFSLLFLKKISSVTENKQLLTKLDDS